MTIDPDEKILGDLSILTDQISLCQSILSASSSSSSYSDDEALLTVIGYLEACVPRMVELIEAAAQGALKASTFEECLLVNDRLTNVLDDVEAGGGGNDTTTGGDGGGAPTPTPPAAAFPAAAGRGGEETSSTIDDGDLEDILQLGMGGLSVAAMGGGKSTGEDGEGGDRKAFSPPRPLVHDDDPFAVIFASL